MIPSEERQRERSNCRLRPRCRDIKLILALETLSHPSPCFFSGFVREEPHELAHLMICLLTLLFCMGFAFQKIRSEGSQNGTRPTLSSRGRQPPIPWRHPSPLDVKGNLSKGKAGGWWVGCREMHPRAYRALSMSSGGVRLLDYHSQNSLLWARRLGVWMGHHLESLGRWDDLRNQRGASWKKGRGKLPPNPYWLTALNSGEGGDRVTSTFPASVRNTEALCKLSGNHLLLPGVKTTPAAF